MTAPLKVWFEAEGRLLRLRLSRPKANLLDAAMIAALAYFDGHLKGKSASSLRFAVKAARFDYAARVKAKIEAVERMYLNDLMKTQDAVEGLQAFLGKRAAQWQHR